MLKLIKNNKMIKNKTKKNQMKAKNISISSCFKIIRNETTKLN